MIRSIGRLVLGLARWFVVLVGAACVGYAIGVGVDELRRWWARPVSRETPPRRSPRGGGLDIWEAIATADELAAARLDPSAAGRRLLERGTAVFDGRLATPGYLAANGKPNRYARPPAPGPAVDSAAVAGAGVPRAPDAGDDDDQPGYAGTI